MKTIYVLKGLPASGKSTWAKKMVSENKNMYKRINKDDLRAMLDCSVHTKGNEKFVLRTRDWLIKEALHAGKHVISDDTNLNPAHEKRIREIAEEYTKETGQQVKVEVKFFEISLEEAIERDLKRPVSVGERVIKSIYYQYLAKPEMMEVNYVEQDKTLPKAIIADVDGTLAILHNRDPYNTAQCEEDLLNEPVADIIKKYAAMGYKIIIVSGREELYRPQTEKWLQKYDIPFDSFLMRPTADERKDSLIKKEIYDNHIKGKYFIDFVLDDRNQVVAMWRKEIGLPCLQVNYGDF